MSAVETCFNNTSGIDQDWNSVTTYKGAYLSGCLMISMRETESYWDTVVPALSKLFIHAGAKASKKTEKPRTEIIGTLWCLPTNECLTHISLFSFCC